MRRLIVRCYPAAWRTRYGDEFASLLEERVLGPFDVADILLGALDAHLHLRGLGAASEHRKGFPMSLRLGGAAAIFGGLMLPVGLGISAVLGEGSGGVAMIAVLVSSVALLIGLAGLSAFQARRHPRTIWAGFALPALGAAVSIVGVVLMAAVGDTDRPIVGELGAWEIWSIGLFGLIGGSILFALATFRTAALSRAAAAVLGIGAALFLTVGIFGVAQVSGIPQGIAVPAAGLTFSAGWVALGADAIRRDRHGVAGCPA